jgi:hypothetical protein
VDHPYLARRPINPVQHGIDFQAGSIGNTVKENVFRDSTTRGIMLRGNRVGILVFGGVDNTLKKTRSQEASWRAFD